VNRDTANWVERDAAVVWHGFTQMSTYTEQAPVIVASAEGRELIDVHGHRYLDAISSLWVNTLGHRVPELDAAVVEQLGRVAHSTMLGNGNRVVIELAEALARRVPVEGPHFLFASDGAAAVEQALKIAFQYWTNLGVRGRTRYVCFGGAYHGDTVGSLSLGAGGFGTEIFDPLRFPVLRAPGYDDSDCYLAAARLIDDHPDEVAALVLEPLVQGAAGMVLAPCRGLDELTVACRKAGVLIICDEVATGFGRTGALFASESAGLRPDLLCLGKGLTAGYLPMSATVACDTVYRAFLGADLGERTFYHGHSYGGNALAAAVALRHLELLDEWSILDNVRARSEQLLKAVDAQIAPLPAVGEVRLCGLMAGIELDPPEPDRRWGRKVCAAAVRRGVLLRPLGDVVVLMPPLTVTADEVERAGCRHHRGHGVAWWEWVDQERRAIGDAGQWRAIRDLDSFGPAGVLCENGREVISFAANDYLGLSRHPAVVAAAQVALERWGAGAGASRLIVGSRPIHSQLEAALAKWKGTERALVFPTGYAANLGVLSSVAGPGVRVCSDELNHASIIDGCRLARAEVTVYPHGDLGAVERSLRGTARSVVVSDTVFSMDGDTADLEGLVGICARHDALLIVDEAHAVLGPELEVPSGATVLRIGTLSKMLGSLGGFVAGPAAFIDLVINRARSFIFTTALSPADTAAALAALDILRSSEGETLRLRLRKLIDRVVPGHPSPIIPIVLGDEQRALAASAALLGRGLLIPAIRPPTVPTGTSRLRVALSAAHTDIQVERLLAGLRGVAGAAA
jgi:adenosylmethionine---8-amino-7-oxononanoate aminotransferase